MAEHSSIEWTDATWNPITGCSVVSPGCTNCYAMKLAGGRLQHHPTRQGLTTPSKAGPVWNGKVRLNEGMLTDPLRWRRPRRIFVCAHGDLFHESVPDEWIDKVFAVMALAPHHTFQVLTKRADRMRAYMRDFVAAHRSVSIAMSALGFKNTEANLQKLTQGHYADNFRPLPNVWLGVSAEDQERADQRIPDLLQTPAAVRFLSAEPLLGPIDLKAWLSDDDGCEGCDDGGDFGTNHCARPSTPRSDQCPRIRAVFDHDEGPLDAHGAPEWVHRIRQTLHWVIVGGESGPGARPLHPDWARQIRDDCAAAGVAFFFKQWGNHLPEGQLDAQGFQWAPGQRGPAVHWWTPEPPVGEALPDGACSIDIGKKAAGRLLDGVEHNAMPGAR